MPVLVGEPGELVVGVAGEGELVDVGVPVLGGPFPAVGSATGAVPALPRVRFPWPPSEPDVRLSPHP
ncbi:hypothetical protein ACHIPZ_25755, partial [Antrihabitans sp. NCIMB 15449]